MDQDNTYRTNNASSDLGCDHCDLALSHSKLSIAGVRCVLQRYWAVLKLLIDFVQVKYIYLSRTSKPLVGLSN